VTAKGLMNASQIVAEIREMQIPAFVIIAKITAILRNALNAMELEFITPNNK
jgi:hypothetical protein